MALLEKFFDVHRTGHNFFDRYFQNAMLEMQAMESEMTRMRSQMFQLFPHNPEGGALDADMQPRVPVVEEHGESKLKLEFNVKDFRPDEVKVKILGNNILQVHAEHEEKSDAGDMKRRLYVRQYSLPRGIDAEHVRPSLTDDGVLTVEAPATSLSPTERLIPIEYKGHADAVALPK